MPSSQGFCSEPALAGAPAAVRDEAEQRRPGLRALWAPADRRAGAQPAARRAARRAAARSALSALLRRLRPGGGRDRQRRRAVCRTGQVLAHPHVGHHSPATMTRLCVQVHRVDQPVQPRGTAEPGVERRGAGRGRARRVHVR